MPLHHIVTKEEGYLHALSAELGMTLDGEIRLLPDNLDPNPNWRDAAREGVPEGWYALSPPRKTGSNFYISEPGKRTAGAGVPTEQTRPPTSRTLSRQNAAPVKGLWVVDQPIVPGIQPLPPELTNGLVKPNPPEVVAAARTFAGFASSIWGWCWGLADESGHRTTTSAVAFTETAIAEGEGLALPLPDLSGTKATYLDLYVGTAIDSQVLQERVPINEINYSTHFLAGPYKDSGAKPPPRNLTGLGVLPAPVIGKPHPHRAYVLERHGLFTLKAGRYRFALQLYPETGGVSLVGLLSNEVVVSADRPNKALYFFPPRGLPEKTRFVPWIQYGPVSTGAASMHKMIPRNRRMGPSFSLEDQDQNRRGVPVYGVTQDVQPAALRHNQMVQEDPPDPNDPASDTTAITPPDATTTPDTPRGYGQAWPTIASYRVANSNSYRKFPYEGPVSEVFVDPTTGKPYITLTGSQTMRVRGADRIGLIPNAEGAERSPDGTVADHTSTGITSPVTRIVSDGVFTFNTSTTIADTAFWTHTWPTVNLPDGTDTVACVVGTITAANHIAGAGQLVLQQLDEAGAVLQTTVLLELGANGSRTLLPLGMRFGPGGTAWNSGTVSVRLRARAKPSETQWNQKFTVKDVQIFPFGTALRKYEEAPPDDPSQAPADPDSVSSGRPYPESSMWALGPAPSVPGAPSQNIAPIAVIDFTGGTIPASLGTRTPTGLPSGLTSVVEADATSPTGTGYRWRLQDTSTSTTQVLYYAKTYTTEVDQEFACRILIKVSQMPTRGDLRLIRISDSGGGGVGVVMLNTNGQLRLYRYKTDGTLNTSYLTVLSGIVAGTILDVELAVAGGSSKNGILRCSAGKNGPRSAYKSFTALDYTNMLPRTRIVGVASESDSASKWTLHYYSIVDTKKGDILDRENPAPPVGDPPVSPDRPTKANPGTWAVSTQYPVGTKIRPTVSNGHEYVVQSISGSGTSHGTTEPTWPTDPGATVIDRPGPNQIVWQEAGSIWREFDVESVKLNQWWGVIEKGAGFNKSYGPTTRRPIMVKPGQVITQAIFARWYLIETNGDPTHHLFVTLKGEDVNPLYVGSPFGSGPDATTVSRTGSGDITGMAAEGSWAERRQTFTVPSGYTEMHVAPYNDCPGVYVFQEHLTGIGNLTTVALRDAERTYGGQTSGTGRIVLDTAIPQDEFTPGKGQFWCGFGANHSRPDLTALTATFRSTSTRPATQGSAIWSPAAPTSNMSLVPQNEILEVNYTLSAIGDERPEIPSGGIFLETRRRLPVLLDENRRDFPGMVFVSDDPIYYAGAEYNEEPVNGHALAIRISDEVDRLPPMTLACVTAESFRALKEATANTIFHIEAPHSEGSGRVFQIRFYSRLEGERGPFTVKVYGGTQRAYGVFSTPEAEVLAIADLSAERGF